MFSVDYVVGCIFCVLFGCCGRWVWFNGLNLLLLCKLVVMMLLIFLGVVSGFVYWKGIILIGWLEFILLLIIMWILVCRIDVYSMRKLNVICNVCFIIFFLFGLMVYDNLVEC